MQGCIEHTQNKPRYGFTLRTVNGKRQCVGLHRAAYCDSRGVSLESIVGLEVRHTCDNPRCVNPDHLVLGTHAENMRDMAERNTRIHGENKVQAKLTQAAVDSIRREYVAGSRTHGQRALAKHYGVSQQCIANVIKGVTW